jgi:hypothetical protein
MAVMRAMTCKMLALLVVLVAVLDSTCANEVSEVEAGVKSRPGLRRSLQVNQTTPAPTRKDIFASQPSFFPTSAPTSITYLTLSRSDFIQASIIGGSVLLGLALFLSQWNRYRGRAPGRKRLAPARNRGGPVGKGGPPPQTPNKVFIDGVEDNGGWDGGGGGYDSRSTAGEEEDYFDAGSGGYGNVGSGVADDPRRATAADTGIQSMLAAKAKSVNNKRATDKQGTMGSSNTQRFTVGRARSQWKSRAATPDHVAAGAGPGGGVNPEMESTSPESSREGVDSVFSRLPFPSARLVYQSTLGKSKKRMGSGESGMAPDRGAYMPRQSSAASATGSAATSGYQQSLMKKKASMAPPQHDEGRIKRNDWRRSAAPSALVNTPRRTHNRRYQTRARTLKGGPGGGAGGAAGGDRVSKSL